MLSLTMIEKIIFDEINATPGEKEMLLEYSRMNIFEEEIKDFKTLVCTDEKTACLVLFYIRLVEIHKQASARIA